MCKHSSGKLGKLFMFNINLKNGRQSKRHQTELNSNYFRTIKNELKRTNVECTFVADFARLQN